MIIYAGRHKGGDPTAVSLPVAGILLAVWVAFLFEDPAAESVASVPSSLLTRRAVRVAAALPSIVGAWALFLAYGNAAGKTATLTLGLAAAVAVSLGFAALGTRVAGSPLGGPIAVAGVFFVFFILPLVFKVSLTLDPVTDSWHHLYGRWLWIGAAGTLMFLAASADPARRGPISWLRGRRTHPAVLAAERVA